MSIKRTGRRAAGALLCLAVFLCGAAAAVLGETVDGVVAVVNTEIITLTDLRIIAAFELYPETRGETSVSLRTVLDRYIDQKLVLRLTGESAGILGQELDDALRDLIRRLGTVEMRRRLAGLDLTEQDLQEHLEAYLRFQSIMSRRFSQAAFVTLREIENHYRERYVPDQEARGRTPRRLTEVLEEIEAVIREEKRLRQAEEWLRKLRLEAEIQLYMDRYPEFFKRGAAPRPVFCLF